MDEHGHYEELMKGISQEYASIFSNSGQGVYMYLDDNHKVCNDKFAKMLGYSSAGDWAQVTDEPFTKMVEDASQEVLVHAFGDVHEKSVASVLDVVWKKKEGGNVKTQVIMVPVSYQNHVFALHFVTPA